MHSQIGNQLLILDCFLDRHACELSVRFRKEPGQFLFLIAVGKLRMTFEMFEIEDRGNE